MRRMFHSCYRDLLGGRVVSVQGVGTQKPTLQMHYDFYCWCCLQQNPLL